MSYQPSQALGFVRSSDKKTRIQKHPLTDSSDSFSSFQFNPQQAIQQFSPYRHPNKARPETSKGTRKHVLQQKLKIVQSSGSPQKPQFSNHLLRNNFQQQYQKEKIERGSQRRQQKSKQKKNEETPQLRQSADWQSELSLSNINKINKNQKEYQSVPLSQQVQQKYPKDLTKYQKYAQVSPSSDSSVHEQQLQKPIKDKVNVNQQKSKLAQQVQPKKDLITSYDKREFKDKHIKRAIQQHAKLNTKNNKGIQQTRGGVCFEIDKTQFKSKNKKGTSKPVKRIKTDINSRDEIRRRKENARIYDQIARTRLFGHYR